MKKILVISTSGFSKKEGISTMILDLLGRFDKAKFKIHLIVQGNYDRGLISEFNNVGIICKYVPSRKKALFKYMKMLNSIFKKEKYDVVYVHGSSAIMSIELFVAALNGCRVRLVHSHNTMCEHKILDKCFRPLFYYLYTDAMACGVDAGKWLYGDRKYLVLKNGRDIRKFSFNNDMRKKIRNQLEISDETLVVGNVGNFNEQKNQAFTLRVFKELLKLKPNSKLVLVGTGEKLNEMRMLSQELGVSNSVIFLGIVNNVQDYLQAMDVMILPSLYEGVPLVVIEWQIARLPSLISDRITRECAFSELVHYKSLDASYLDWANELIKISAFERNEISIDIDGLAIENGFDIESSVMFLENYILKRCG